GSVATVLSLLVTVLTLLAPTPRASAPGQQQDAPTQTRTGPRLVGSIPVRARPSGLVMATDGRHAYVTHLSGAMSVIDTATNTVTATINVGGVQWSVAVTPGAMLETCG